MAAGNTLISMDEPKYKKYKNTPLHGNWSPGDWNLGDPVWGKDGLQAMWGTSTRGPGARVARYRKNLLKNKIIFTEFTHPAGKISGFSKQSAVVEFIFFKEGDNGKLV